MNQPTFLLCILAVLIPMQSVCRAALYVSNDPGFPASTDGNNITTDTATGLQWLDTSCSLNIPYNTITGQFGAGATYEGFRHATPAEVQAFFNHLSLNTTNFPAVTVVFDNGLSALHAQTFVGTTEPGVEAIGIYDSSGPGVHDTSSIRADATRSHVGDFRGTVADSGSFTIVGHWLVRDDPAGASNSLGQILAMNAATETDTNLVTDPSGNLLPAGSGFVAIGSFDVTDAEIITASGTAAAGSYFDEHFTIVRTVPMGLGEFGGLYELAAETPGATSSLLGKDIYTLIGDGTAPETSSAFLVFKHNLTFDTPAFISLTNAVLTDNGGGTLLVGGIGLFQAELDPFELNDAFSLSESGALGVVGIPSELTVEPGTSLGQMLSATSGSATFSLAFGPSWVQVAPDGTVTAQPPFGTTGRHHVVIRADEDAPGSGVVEVAFFINVRGSFAVWQARNFDLPAESALAGPMMDPDGDGEVNLFEYATREENGADLAPFAMALDVGLDPQGQLTASMAFRDDDPDLSIWFEASTDLMFDPVSFEGGGSLPLLPTINLFAGETTSLGSGWSSFTFRDAEPAGSGSKNFVRAVLSLE